MAFCIFIRWFFSACVVLQPINDVERDERDMNGKYENGKYSAAVMNLTVPFALSEDYMLN